MKERRKRVNKLIRKTDAIERIIKNNEDKKGRKTKKGDRGKIKIEKRKDRKRGANRKG